MDTTRTPLLRTKMFWVGLLYFAEGLPLGIFYDIFPVYFRQQGVDLRDIGLIALLGLAWSIKYLWAPAIDRYRHHRRWMAAVDLGMAMVLLLFALSGEFGPWVWFAIGLFTLLSATNDIAIDGYTIERLNQNELGRANGLRIAFYRVGMLTAGFLLVLSDYLGWLATYLAAALLLATLAWSCLQAPTEETIEARQKTGSVGKELRAILRHPLTLSAVIGLLLGTLWLIDRTAGWSQQWPQLWDYALVVGAVPLLAVTLRRLQGATTAASEPPVEGPLFGALLDLLRRPLMLPMLGFILIFKLGDSAMGFMVKPFWVDAGFSASEIGLVSVNIGLVLSIAGGVAGGWLTDRFGIFHALWSLGLAQALSNLGYAWAAAVVPLQPAAEIPLDHTLLMYGASALESFTGGLGTAAFLAFLMAIVNRRHAATEYALLSSVFALSRSLANWAGGYGAASLGYADYFLLTFFLALPAYLLLPWVRRMLARTDQQPV